MAKPTRQELLCTFLTTKKGLKEVRAKTSKYRVFQISQDKFYFVGANGALRIGKNVSDSVSLTPNPKIFKQEA